MKKQLMIFLFFAFSTSSFCYDKNLMVPAIFSDNMVLQQLSNISIWGKGEPNIEIKVIGSWGEMAESKINEDSTWLVKIKTPKAGGPFILTITNGKSSLKFKNILIGEVWLCSGQSNMEMPLEGWPPKDTILNSEEEIKHSGNDQIRFFTVARDMSVEPKFNCIGSWVESSPKTSSAFSATAYFYGKKLFNELKIPIGLIHSSWGGTPAESWISRQFLAHISEFDSVLKIIGPGIPFSKQIDQWLLKYPTIDMTKIKGENIWSGLNFNDEKYHEISYKDSNWDVMDLPTNWENTKLGEFDGVIWFRKNVMLPKSWLNKELKVELGPIDDFDVTFVNGVKIGENEVIGNWQIKRVYNIPAAINTKENMLLSVRVNDNGGGGGLYGKPEEMNLVNVITNEKISISGQWHFLPVAEFRGMTYYIFGSDEKNFNSRPILPFKLASKTPTLLYNAMIAPLIPFSIKGVIWYQGESNAGNPKLYETLFPTLIKNWRNDFGNNFPFYFVQIAPYDYGNKTNSEYLRDVQRKTLNLEKTGMVVTLDIGDTNNIHPANKKDVGERLALWALAKDYNKNILCSGPLYKTMKIKGNIIELEFENNGSGLLLNNVKNQFTISGADMKFIAANAKIENDKLYIWSESVKEPKAVRYAWRNNAQAALFNKEGLPASSFRTDSWEK